MKTRTLCIIITVCGIFACSEQALKRTGYETLQNVRQQECQSTPTVECEQRESLEIYQQQRETIEHGSR